MSVCVDEDHEKQIYKEESGESNLTSGTEKINTAHAPVVGIFEALYLSFFLCHLPVV